MFGRDFFSNLIIFFFFVQIIEEFPDAPARFGAEIPASGLRVTAVKGVPETGCSAMQPPPYQNTTGRLRWCVIIAR